MSGLALAPAAQVRAFLIVGAKPAVHILLHFRERSIELLAEGCRVEPIFDRHVEAHRRCRWSADAAPRSWCGRARTDRSERPQYSVPRSASVCAAADVVFRKNGTTRSLSRGAYVSVGRSVATNELDER